jgi:hypothetical protein
MKIIVILKRKLTKHKLRFLHLFKQLIHRKHKIIIYIKFVQMKLIIKVMILVNIKNFKKVICIARIKIMKIKLFNCHQGHYSWMKNILK